MSQQTASLPNADPNEDDDEIPVSETPTGQRLRNFIERVERLEEEKKALGDDIKEVYAEAKGQGFDTKVMKKIVMMRKQDPDDRAEEEALLDTYMAALGMR